MTEELLLKYKKLKDILTQLGSVAVAFSGGVDSTLLLKVAHDVLGEKAMAVTAKSEFFPEREYNEAIDFCRGEAIRQVIAPVSEYDIPGFRQNPKNRCYICKKSIFTKLLNIAKEHGIEHIAEGSNMDDDGDYRPGHIAIKEIGAKSPLREAGLYKEEIRELSRMLGLPTSEKPSFACLASRFVYGEEITEEKLHMVEKAEQLLMNLGFVQYRVRIHGTIARLEVYPEDFGKIMEATVRTKLTEELKNYGFSYVTLDLQGFRSGSMNETLSMQEKSNVQDVILRSDEEQ